MSSIYVYVLYDKKIKRPCCVGIMDNNNIKVCELYRPGAGKIIKRIEDTVKIVRKIILKANDNNRKIITNDFKSLIKTFSLPIDMRKYNVYDQHLPDVASTNSLSKDHKFVRQVLDKMASKSIKKYHNIIAEAAVVYQDLENNGVSVNHLPMHPTWSMKTFSGRSKTTGFNLQGMHENFHVTPNHDNESDVLIHFDWICADIRVASIMSGDQRLKQAFKESDPYNVMMDYINKDVELPTVGGFKGDVDKISRNESKLYLLKSINSMDINSVALTKVYPELGDWIYSCKSLISSGKPLESLLGRKFRLARSKNELAVLNGIMQGSVAHAMHCTIRRIWEKLPTKMVGEIHDCLVMSSSPDKKEIKAIIDIVYPIMLNPFEGVVDDNPSFPLNVSIGKRWKSFKNYKTYR